MNIKKICFLTLALLTFSSLKAQRLHQSYDQLISDVSRVFDESLKHFKLTPESKKKVKETAIQNFRRKYDQQSFKDNIKLTDNYFMDPVKESILLYSDSTKFKWHLLKESQLLQEFNKEASKLGYTGEMVDNWCNCVVQKIMIQYPNADFDMNDNAVSTFTYNVSKECALLYFDVNKMDNNNIPWNDNSKSAITKAILKNHEHNLSGIYNYNELISLTKWQVDALVRDFPKGLKVQEMRSEKVIDSPQKEYDLWKKSRN
ncbi:hypothetical protein ORI89_18480 [Sphingobacterium sp. UT-1RO-CII-1]|uniref:hypothetical protein n=1 Tax=Sphingobacterium sp. UT-1RO-CII-1 TaxID=2995225 RepID=UPI00227CFE16|nr:hypothetical protein [Sphingobacterium sp. UT-1RO-CII-1]MCY4781646.1 hypothetical protein [Sphingobacterium sp. UT-1RO-CII-1]